MQILKVVLNKAQGADPEPNQERLSGRILRPTRKGSGGPEPSQESSAGGPNLEILSGRAQPGVILNYNTILWVVTKTSTLVGSGGLWRFCCSFLKKGSLKLKTCVFDNRLHCLLTLTKRDDLIINTYWNGHNRAQQMNGPNKARGQTGPNK